ncbi:MAG: TlyA family RNA methyltransferase [Clostridia bacterium]|nr:TlyA family RNA methyltransferase [Clostridia bacterium]
MRIDTYLADHGLAKSRSFAKILIDEGFVTVNGVVVKKPSIDVSDFDRVLVTGAPYSYVSRGGVKLEAALERFEISVLGLTAVDIGASSGGFTDCLLKRGAVKVFAVDSGSGQLDSSLCHDERVVNIENFNARNLTADDLGQTCDIAVTDVSFISQTLIIPAAVKVLCEGGLYVSLIKPQFECGKSGLGKGGIVKSKKIMAECIKKVISCAAQNGLGCFGLIRSPIQGGDGNTEFLMCCELGRECSISDETILREVGV